MKPRFVVFAGAIATTFVSLVNASAAVADDLSFTYLDHAHIPATAARAPGYKPGMHLCSTQVYLSKAGRRGVNLRAGPGRGFPIVGHLPKIDAEWLYPSFQIIGSRNGWFLIRNPYQGGGQYGELKLLYKGSAWLAPHLVDFHMEGYTLYSRPHIRASVLLNLKGSEDEWNESDVTVERVHGCSGRFLDITVRRGSEQRVRGWFAAMCGDQHTLCGFGDDPVLVEERQGKLVSSRDSD